MRLLSCLLPPSVSASSTQYGLRLLSSSLMVLLLLAGSAPALAQSPDLSIDPKHGQMREQQLADRSECAIWAKGQTGYDPLLPAAAQPPNANTSRREQSRRAMTACLEARGYTVHYGAPPPPPPPRNVVHSSPRPEFKYHPLALQIEGGYTIAQGALRSAINDGWNSGLGLIWFPSSALPLGLRIDGSYSRFEETSRSVNLASMNNGTHVSFGHLDLYGGDVDLELDLPMGPRVKEYIFGGVGWYREHTTFEQASYQPGYSCFYYCFPGYFRVVSTVAQDTTGWLHSWNAGVGFEFALADQSSFFIEARYQRISPSSKMTEFVPIRVGLRF
jgi:opacity protein-like surface antigen